MGSPGWTGSGAVVGVGVATGTAVAAGRGVAVGRGVGVGFETRGSPTPEADVAAGPWSPAAGSSFAERESDPIENTVRTTPTIIAMAITEKNRTRLVAPRPSGALEALMLNPFYSPIYIPDGGISGGWAARGPAAWRPTSPFFPIAWFCPFS